jgi:enamine deaminase RidA (YjgF/YER057c/UK114 family)
MNDDSAYTTVAAPEGADCADRLFEQLEGVLAAEGWGLRDILKLRIFYSDQSQYPPFSAARGPRFRAAFPDGAFPAATGLVTGGRGVRPGIEVEAMMSRDRRTFNSDRVYRSFPGVTSPPAFAHLAERSDLVLLSGQTGFDVDGATVAEDIRGQTLATLANLRAVLVDSGLGVDALQKFTVYVTDPTFREAALEEVATFAGERGPATATITTIVVDELFKPGVYVEIEAVGTRADAKSSPWRFGTGCSVAERDGTVEVDVIAVGQALDAVEEWLRGEGLGFDDVVACTIWLAAPQPPPDVRARLLSRLPSARACQTTVPMQPHADEGGRALIEVVARRQTR